MNPIWEIRATSFTPDCRKLIRVWKEHPTAPTQIEIENAQLELDCLVHSGLYDESDLGILAEKLSHAGNYAAVEITDKVLGIGVVHYKDWY